MPIDNSVASWLLYHKAEVQSVILTKKGSLEIIKKAESNIMPNITRVVKDIYGIKDNKIVLIDSIDGEYIPRKVTEEQFIF